MNSSTAADSSSEPVRSRRLPLVLALIALTVVTLDVITKVLVVEMIAPGENIRILGGVLYLTHIRNPGAAFSMGTGLTWLLASIAIVVVIFIIRLAPKLRSTPWAMCLGLVLGGALGNLADRVFRAPGVMRGHVVDFLSVFAPNAQRFPAFNVADMAITCGGIVLVALALCGFDYDGTRHRKSATPAAIAADGATAADNNDNDLATREAAPVETATSDDEEPSNG